MITINELSTNKSYKSCMWLPATFLTLAKSRSSNIPCGLHFSFNVFNQQHLQIKLVLGSSWKIPYLDDRSRFSVFWNERSWINWKFVVFLAWPVFSSDVTKLSTSWCHEFSLPIYGVTFRSNSTILFKSEIFRRWILASLIKTSVHVNLYSSNINTCYVV